jgi:phosphoglycolate phosphatase-like HAD superfamily hydrolase
LLAGWIENLFVSRFGWFVELQLVKQVRRRYTSIHVAPQRLIFSRRRRSNVSSSASSTVQPKNQQLRRLSLASTAVFMKRAFLLFQLVVLMASGKLTQGFAPPGSSPTAAKMQSSLSSSPSPDTAEYVNTVSINPSGRPVKAILFDVDGTLADSWKLCFNATLVVLERHNIPPITPEIYHQHTRYSTPSRMARHAGYEPGDAEFERVGNELGREFDDLYVNLVSLETANFYPGITRLLQRIPAHIQLGALTNAAVKYADAVLKCNCPVYSRHADDVTGSQEAAIFSRFASIRGADNVPLPKPAPDGLLVVCQDLQVHPKDCVYVGDSPTDGMAASAAGMPAIGVTWGSHREATLKGSFDRVCHSVGELEEVLQQLVAVE